MNIETRGNPKVSVSYEGVEAGGESGCIVAFEIIGILLFLLLIGVLR